MTSRNVESLKSAALPYVYYYLEDLGLKRSLKRLKEECSLLVRVQAFNFVSQFCDKLLAQIQVSTPSRPEESLTSLMYGLTISFIKCSQNLQRDMSSEQSEETTSKKSMEKVKKKKKDGKKKSDDKSEKSEKKKSERKAEKSEKKSRKEADAKKKSKKESKVEESRKRKREEEEVTPTTAEAPPAAEPRQKKPRTDSVANRFVKVDASAIEIQNSRLQDNSYFAHSKATGESWGLKAAQDLIVVQGDRFRHEKTKKKRGSYKGGVLSNAVNSVKLDSSDSDD